MEELEEEEEEEENQNIKDTAAVFVIIHQSWIRCVQLKIFHVIGMRLTSKIHQEELGRGGGFDLIIKKLHEF